MFVVCKIEMSIAWEEVSVWSKITELFGCCGWFAFAGPNALITLLWSLTRNFSFVPVTFVLAYFVRGAVMLCIS